jgi:GntR family transcriptional regulator
LKSLDRNVLYSQVKDKIETEIKNGKYAAGDALPSEFQLCKDHEVSRTTIRLALQQLELEGRITKIQGKGTFVSKPKIKQSLTSSSKGFGDQMVDQGLKPRSNVLSLKVIPADTALAEYLQIHEKDPVNELVRVRFADDEPLQYETSYIPWKSAPGLVDDDCQGSLFQLLRSKYSIQINKTIESIEPVLATENISKHLNIPPGAPVFSIETITYNSENTPVEYSSAIFRGDRSKFTVERLYN